jgi:hypothetical protein
MASIPQISSMTDPHDMTIREGEFVFVFAGSMGADAGISIKSVTPKAIATKR